MFKGFSLCSHITNQGLPSGAGRKGGVPKRKRKSPVKTVQCYFVSSIFIHILVNQVKVHLTHSSSPHTCFFSVYNSIARFSGSVCSWNWSECRYSLSLPSLLPSLCGAQPVFQNTPKPFILKLKTKQIQSCCKDYRDLLP